MTTELLLIEHLYVWTVWDLMHRMPPRSQGWLVCYHHLARRQTDEPFSLGTLLAASGAVS